MSLEKDKCNLCALKVIFDQDAVRGDAEKYFDSESVFPPWGEVEASLGG